MYSGFLQANLVLNLEARRALASYSFPGNIRELKNIVDYAVMVCPGEAILPEHLPAHLSLEAGRGKSRAKAR